MESTGPPDVTTGYKLLNPPGYNPSLGHIAGTPRPSCLVCIITALPDPTQSPQGTPSQNLPPEGPCNCIIKSSMYSWATYVVVWLWVIIMCFPFWFWMKIHTTQTILLAGVWVTLEMPDLEASWQFLTPTENLRRKRKSSSTQWTFKLFLTPVKLRCKTITRLPLSWILLDSR